MKKIKVVSAKTDFTKLAGVGLLIAGYVSLIINSLPNVRMSLIILFLGWFAYNKITIKIGSKLE